MLSSTLAWQWPFHWWLHREPSLLEKQTRRALVLPVEPPSPSPPSTAQSPADGYVDRDRTHELVLTQPRGLDACSGGKEMPLPS